MKLIANNDSNSEVVNFTVVQDGNEVNIEANGEVVVFFRQDGDKIRLHTLEIDSDHLFHVDEDNNLESEPFVF